MSAQHINVVVLTGNLTRDPELRTTHSGTSVGNLRIACNGRRKVGGEWVDRPDFFDITVWGGQAENCNRFLSKGSPVAVEGRLEYQEWESEGNKRSKVVIIANSVQFLSSGQGQQGGGSSPSSSSSDIPNDLPNDDFTPSTGAGGFDDQDDIPF